MVAASIHPDTTVNASAANCEPDRKTLTFNKRSNQRHLFCREGMQAQQLPATPQQHPTALFRGLQSRLSGKAA